MLTLCTYTYNDGPMARRLLELAASFPLRPDEAVVVDDGSAEPFRAPDLPFPVRVLRHESNRGITETKREGIKAARGTVIWSVDCDIVPAPDWLALCLPRLAQPGVGLVGGHVLPAPGELSVDRYVRRFEPMDRRSGPVDFIAGTSWLFSRAAWDRAGGFRDHAEAVIEDQAFCLHLKEAGYTLFLEERAKARATRRFSRRAMAKRFWKWVRPGMKDLLRQGQDPFLAFFQPMGLRLQAALVEEEPAFVYLDLLYLCYAMLDTQRLVNDRASEPGGGHAGGGDGEGTARAARDLAGFWPGMAAAFAGLPRLLGALAGDLAAMGYAVEFSGDGVDGAGGLRPGGVGDGELSSIPSVLAGLRQVLDQSGALDWLEREGVTLLDAEEARGEYDFSGYGEGL